MLCTAEMTYEHARLCMGLNLHRHFNDGLEGFHWESGQGIERPGKRARGKEKRGGRKEKRGGKMDKPVHPLCYGTAFLWLTPSFQHRSSKSCITFVYSEGGMDRQGYASPFSCPLLLPLLFSPTPLLLSPGPFSHSPYTLSTLSVKPL